MNKQILRLAVPNIISNITIPLLNLIDLALMGHWGGIQYIGAVSVGGTIFNFLFWAFSFLRMGTSGFTAQAYGQQDSKEQAHLFFRAFITSLIAGCILIIVQYPIEILAFKLIHCSPNVQSLTSQYFQIRIWSAPAAIAIFVFTGWFIGMQNATFPMITAIVINIINITLNLFFVFECKMQAKGIALGETISQYAGLIISLIFIILHYPWIRKYFDLSEILNLSRLKIFFKVNTDILIRTFCIITVFTLFTSKSAGINDITLATNTLLLQFLLFFSFFIDGFAYAGEALTGKFIGRKDPGNTHRIIILLFKWGGILALIFSISYLFFSEKILAELSSSIEIVKEARPFLPWVIILPIISFTSYIWDGIYVGATASKGMRNALLISTFGLFLPVYLFLFPLLKNHAIWLSMTLFMLGRGLLQTLMAKKQIKIKR